MQGGVTWAFAFAFAELPSFAVLELSSIVSRDDPLLSLSNVFLGTVSLVDEEGALSTSVDDDAGDSGGREVAPPVAS